MPRLSSYHSVGYSGWWLPGLLAATILFALIGMPLLALLAASTTDLQSPLQNAYLKSVIRFTFFQAFLSTVLSVGLAIPVARAISRQSHFPGRRFLLNLFSISLIIPGIVAIFGIVAVFGRNGWMNQSLQALGFSQQVSLYGLTGILIAHVFFNLPLSVRILLQALDAIKPSHWRLAAELGMGSYAVFRYIEWPAIRAQLPALLVLVFSLCFTSFAIVLTLGGGPRATTLEVAIYQALRFDFDLSTAVSLALLQMFFCITLILILSLAGKSAAIELSAPVSPARYRKLSKWAYARDFLLIGSSLVFVVTPLAALMVSSFNPALSKVLLDPSTLHAMGNSVIVAVCSGILSVLLGVAILLSSRHLIVRSKVQILGHSLEAFGFAILIVPPVVLGTGLFILLREHADVFSLALVLVILVNALMGLPFCIRILQSGFIQSAMRYDRTCQALGLQGLQRARFVEWPLLRKPLGLALAVSTTLSAGDLTLIALFGSERIRTLPLLLYQRMGSYRLYEAAVTAMLLLLLCATLFWLIERLVGGRSA